jgi:CMP-2-keto-3-deoxyoctulosonic acid synthetase
MEQLRLLQSNFKYYCVETKHDLHGVDTPEDLEKVNKIILQ